jgi:hypothetical protein
MSYRPRHPDGHPDPGEIVWARVPFEDDPTQSKIRPVVIIGRAKNGNLVAVQSTSKSHRPGSIPVAWSNDKISYIRPERLIQIDANNYQKEGSYIKRPKFQEIVDLVSSRHGGGLVQLSALFDLFRSSTEDDVLDGSV